MKIEHIPYMISTPTVIAGAGVAGTATNNINMTAGIIVAAIGSICTVGTFVVNWYYKHQNMKLSERASGKGIKPEEL